MSARRLGLSDVKAALKRGVTLRFDGINFEESQRKGSGPLYTANAVLWAARSGFAVIITRGTDRDGFEVEVRLAPERTQQALERA